VISQRNLASLQPCHELNIAIATIAMPVARFLHGLAFFDSLCI